MKTTKKQTRTENRKRHYAKPEIKKREQIKEVIESPAIITLGPPK